MSLLRRLLSPEYWLVAEPGPLAPMGIALYAALGLAFLAGIVLALRSICSSWRKQQAGAPAGEPLLFLQCLGWLEPTVSLAGLVTIAGRFLGWPGWSARIWPPFLAASALLGVLIRMSSRWSMPCWLNSQMRILALLPPGNTSSPAPPGLASDDCARGSRVRGMRTLALALGFCLHLTGIAFVLEARFGLPGWLAPALLAILLVPQIPLLLRRKPVRLQALTPLLAGYLVTLLWSVYHLLGITVVGWQGLSFPDPMTSLFYVDGILLAGVAYSWLCQLFYACSSYTHPATGSRPRLLHRTVSAWHWVMALLLLASSAWTAAVYLGKRTHGATGSDPFAYTQMAVDLADHGTLLHRFSLFGSVLPLGIAWGPLLPSGYHLPINDLGDSPSVWATGASVLLAGGYRLLGETGLYVTTPIIALLALLATWFLVLELLRGEAVAVRCLVAALTVALTATSPEYVDRLLVPMADAAAQLFTILTLWFGLRAMRLLRPDPRRALPSLVLAGFSFAWAYWVRHTQLVLFLPVAIGLWLASPRSDHSEPLRGTRASTFRLGLRRLQPLLIFSVSAGAMAIPDTIYRCRVFGGIFATETTELPAMAIRNIAPMAVQTLKDTLVASEWGYLFPFAIIGSCLLARRNRRAFLVLGGAFASVLLVHLTYRFLRLRDLISLFPLVNIAVCYGAVGLVRFARAHALVSNRQRRLRPVLLCALSLAWVIVGLALARWTMIDELWKPGWASFGYMRADQRAAFDRLAALTPPDAVIGASLNSGAVMMYTGRNSIRPYESWSAGDWATFVETMWANSRQVYLLDDGSLMSDFIRGQGTEFRLIPQEELSIPLFDAPGRSTGWLYELVRHK